MTQSTQLAEVTQLFRRGRLPRHLKLSSSISNTVFETALTLTFMTLILIGKNGIKMKRPESDYFWRKPKVNLNEPIVTSEGFTVKQWWTRSRRDN